MNNDEKLEKVCKEFSSLSEKQQEYIIGIMQALAFANSTCDLNDSESADQTAQN